MKNINTQQELYISLASEGDPSAFYSLFRKQFEAQYKSLRAEGQSHSESSESVFKNAAGLFRKFIGKNISDAEEWFSSQENKTEDFEIQKNETNLSAAELDLFRNELQLVLQRAYSSLLKNRSSKSGKLKLKPSPAVIVITGAALTVAAAAATLFFSQTTLTLSLERDGSEYRLAIPGGVSKISTDTVSQISSQPDMETTAQKADSTSDKDTVVSRPAQKKKTPTVTSKPRSVPKSRPARRNVATPAPAKPRPVAKPNPPKPKPAPKPVAPKPQKPAVSSVPQPEPAPATEVNNSVQKPSGSTTPAVSDDKPVTAEPKSKTATETDESNSSLDLDDLLDMPGMRKAQPDSQ
ncbi:MAG: hypothetical protein ACOC36_05690 [Fibrobacterota bacterium]